MFPDRVFSGVKQKSVQEVRDYLAEKPVGSYSLVDVRTPAEYTADHLQGARLIPINELADRLDEIDRIKPVIAYCLSGSRSLAAARLMEGQGFKEVYNMSGGMSAWEDETAFGPPELGMDALTGDETPEEVVFKAYGLEEGLRKFYVAMVKKAGDEKAAVLFKKLVGYEDLHKDALYELYLNLSTEPLDRQFFESNVEQSMMEGGLTGQEFMARYAWAVETELQILDLAMSIETQALDLYLRFAAKVEHEGTRAAILRIAEDEKKHLNALSDLRGRI